jgi:hypothetical protein
MNHAIEVYRKDNRRRDERQWRRRFCASVLTGAVVAAVLLYRLSDLADRCRIDARLHRRNCCSSANSGAQRRQVSGMKSSPCGFKQGMNIWKVDPVAIES